MCVYLYYHTRHYILDLEDEAMWPGCERYLFRWERYKQHLTYLGEYQPG
jgi:hypothetical protein